MICVLLSLPKKPQSDAADALGVAVCHGHHSQTRRRMLAGRQANNGVPV